MHHPINIGHITCPASHITIKNPLNKLSLLIFLHRIPYDKEVTYQKSRRPSLQLNVANWATQLSNKILPTKIPMLYKMETQHQLLVQGVLPTIIITITAWSANQKIAMGAASPHLLCMVNHPTTEWCQNCLALAMAQTVHPHLKVITSTNIDPVVHQMEVCCLRCHLCLLVTTAIPVVPHMGEGDLPLHSCHTAVTLAEVVVRILLSSWILMVVNCRPSNSSTWGSLRTRSQRVAAIHLC